MEDLETGKRITGIHDAIARKLNEKGKLSKNAIAEGIINNVRKTIIRDQLTDPAFYEESGYEEVLNKYSELQREVAALGSKGDAPVRTARVGRRRRAGRA